jgi:hypothetical protein
MAEFGTAASSVGLRPAYNPARPSFLAMDLNSQITPTSCRAARSAEEEAVDVVVVDSNRRMRWGDDEERAGPPQRYCGATRHGKALVGRTSPLDRTTAPRPRSRALTEAGAEEEEEDEE